MVDIVGWTGNTVNFFPCIPLRTGFTGFPGIRGRESSKHCQFGQIK